MNSDDDTLDTTPSNSDDEVVCAIQTRSRTAVNANSTLDESLFDTQTETDTESVPATPPSSDIIDRASQWLKQKQPETLDQEAFQLYLEQTTQHKKHLKFIDLISRSRRTWGKLPPTAKCPFYNRIYNLDMLQLKTKYQPVPFPNDCVVLAKFAFSQSRRVKKRVDHSLEDELENLKIHPNRADIKTSTMPLPSSPEKDKLQRLERDEVSKRKRHALFRTRRLSWSVSDHSPLSDETNLIIEQGIQQRRGVLRDAFFYDVILTGCQINICTGLRTPLLHNGKAWSPQRTYRLLRLASRRKPCQVPETWTLPSMDKLVPVICPLSAHKDHEFDNVHQLFSWTSSASMFQIERISRIENVTLWRLFRSHVRQTKFKTSRYPLSEGTRGKPGQVQYLFCGTPAPDVHRISSQGFYRNQSKLSFPYFSTTAQFATQDHYSPVDSETGLKSVFLCQVMTGLYSFENGRQVYDKSLPLLPEAFDLHDTMVDDMSHPTVFTTFHEYQAYPMFLIEFRDRHV